MQGGAADLVLVDAHAEERAQAIALAEAKAAAVAALTHRDLGPARLFIHRLSSGNMAVEALPALFLLFGAPCVLLVACCAICIGCYFRRLRAASHTSSRGARGNKYDRIAEERDPLEAQWQAHVEAAVALSAPTEVVSTAQCSAAADKEARSALGQCAVNQSRRLQLQSDETVIMELATEVDYVYPGATGPPVLMCD